MATIPANYRRLEGSERRPRKGARLVGPADTNETFRVIVVVRRRPDAPPLPDLAYWTATPPGRRKFLSTEEFRATYGALQAELDRVAGFARSHGLTVMETNVARRTVVVRGTVEQMNRAFAVELGRYESPTETYRGRHGYVHLPNDVADLVEGVFGLDNRRLGDNDTGGNDPPATTRLTVPQVASMYNFPGGQAANQVIGIPTFDGGGFNTSDLQSYFNYVNGINGTNLGVPTVVQIPPNSNNPGNPSADFELTQDICVASSVAAGATIAVYFETPDQLGWVDFLTRALHPTGQEPHPSVLSISRHVSADDATSLANAGFTSNYVMTLESLLQQAATVGVTILASSGDHGAQPSGTNKFQVYWPSSNPYLTACGGTTIGNVMSQTQFEEWVWNDKDFFGTYATGGGISDKYSLPPYQNGIVNQQSLTDGHVGRGVPDVAGNASRNSGYQLWLEGNSKDPNTNQPYVANGTSIVAPLYAGLVALINQSLGQRIGFLNPTLYAFRDSVCRDINDQQVPQNEMAPPDNGAGTAQGYPSGPGWDACTGLGAIDGGALLAALKQVFQKDCQFITDRTEIGEDEVKAVNPAPTPQNPALIPNAFYVIVDGFTPNDLGITPASLVGTPNVAPAFTTSAPGMSVGATALLAEDNSLAPTTPQRFTWVCEAEFTDLTAFAGAPRSVTLHASIATVAKSATIELVLHADPYELDGPTSWLSTDLRVFQMKTNATLPGLPPATNLQNTGNPQLDAPTFIKGVIDALNADKTPPPNHPFDQISTDEQTSEVTIASTDANNNPVYNFAVARVRYQSGTDSGPVRVFFRIFQASTTSTAYEPQTYATVINVNLSKIPVFGVDGMGNVVAIPCFADARVSAPTRLIHQTDDKNTVAGGIKHDPGGAVVYTYFGCWLDINQSMMTNAVPLPPVPVDSDKPWANGSESVFAAIRSQHQCLVAEISYDSNPVQPGETPASSDKLAQRNLAIVPSANPGDAASRRIPQTFDIRPTPGQLPVGGKPDELMLQWGNTPVGSPATIYLPGVRAAQVLEMASKMYVSHRLEWVDDHTLRCRTAGVTYVPIPQGVGANFAGLLSVDLPATVRKGQAFTIAVRQITDAIALGPRDGTRARRRPPGAAAKPPAVGRRILSSFQLTMPVRTRQALLQPEERLLSVLRWIGEGITADDRWSPVFNRYLAEIADRVRALGGDPDLVLPSTTGLWHHPPRPGEEAHELAFTGKVAGLVYGRFGDFTGFLLETNEGEQRTFESRETEVERLVHRALTGRIVITVFVKRHHQRHPVSIILRRVPPFQR